MTDFDTLACLPRTGDARWSGTFPAAWTQGRSIFGGLTAAAGLRALETLAPPDRALLSVDVAFVAPVAPDTPVELDASLLRSGGHVTTLEARLAQGGAPATRVLATFGRPRPSRIDVAPPAGPAAPWPGQPLPFLEGLTPTFVRQFELSFTFGAAPFTGSSQTRFGGHVRHRTHASGHAATLGLIDAWPAPVLPLASRPCAASTVRWSVHLFGPPRPPGTAHYFEAEVVSAHAGYATTAALLHAPDGAVVARSEQLVAIFDER